MFLIERKNVYAFTGLRVHAFTRLEKKGNQLGYQFPLANKLATAETAPCFNA
jgi:hypothetical protein